MLNHRTDDNITTRAIEIAQREAEVVWQKTLDLGEWLRAYDAAFRRVYKELKKLTPANVH